jgi:hypothetical protein
MATSSLAVIFLSKAIHSPIVGRANLGHASHFAATHAGEALYRAFRLHNGFVRIAVDVDIRANMPTSSLVNVTRGRQHRR